MRMLNLGCRPYAETEAAMRAFTAARTAETEDELWLVEHESVFTQGVGGRDVHVLAAGSIPVLRTDRGGQVTYHGPGQVVAYPLMDLRRLGIYVKEYVFRIEEAVINTLWECGGVVGHRVRGAPGIYVRLADPHSHARLQAEPPGAGQGLAPDAFQGLGKIAALGIKVSQHRAYHGVALNVAMDLEPFTRIDPCGYANLRTVDLQTLGVQAHWAEVAAQLARQLHQQLHQQLSERLSV
jgi:lipoyl(octanoyl) transferase